MLLLPPLCTEVNLLSPLLKNGGEETGSSALNNAHVLLKQIKELASNRSERQKEDLKTITTRLTATVKVSESGKLGIMPILPMLLCSCYFFF